MEQSKNITDTLLDKFKLELIAETMKATTMEGLFETLLVFSIPVGRMIGDDKANDIVDKVDKMVDEAEKDGTMAEFDQSVILYNESLVPTELDNVIAGSNDIDDNMIYETQINECPTKATYIS